MCNKHFTEDSVVEHMQKARKKGKQAFSEFHAVEAPGHIAAAADSATDSAISSLLVFMIAHTLAIPMDKIFILLIVLMSGLFLWKVGRSMHLAWARLDRINALVSEEKYEIEHNREEEREELTEMYAAKGFREPLLTKIIDVLMADDNKLLAVMLEEELGVPMEAYVHPIKQALGAGIGVLLTAATIPLGLVISESFGLFLTTFAITGIAAFFLATIERISRLEYTIKSLAITFLAAFTTYFFTKFLIQEILG